MLNQYSHKKLKLLRVIKCPKCSSENFIKSGVVKGRQRYKCNQCNYNFTVVKEGKNIDAYYVVKALQLYLEGVSYREIERLLGIQTHLQSTQSYRIN